MWHRGTAASVSAQSERPRRHRPLLRAQARSSRTLRREARSTSPACQTPPRQWQRVASPEHYQTACRPYNPPMSFNTLGAPTNRRWRHLSAVYLAAVLLAACGQVRSNESAAGAITNSCDRACLDGMVNRYLDALVAHDPAKIPTTPNVRFVENGVALPLGSALWKTASGRGTYRHYFADVAAGQAGFIGTMREHGKGLILVLRLAVDEQTDRGDRTAGHPHRPGGRIRKAHAGSAVDQRRPRGGTQLTRGTDGAGRSLLHRHAAERSEGRLLVLPQGVQPRRARSSDHQHAAVELRALRHSRTS